MSVDEDGETKDGLDSEVRVMEDLVTREDSERAATMSKHTSDV